MAISDLISKIKEDTQNEAQSILAKASQEEKEIVQKRIVEANHERNIILEKAHREAKSRADRILSGAELKVRNDKLEVKQSIIQKVFDLALQKLENLSQEELLSFIKKSIFEAPFEGEVDLILSSEYKEKVTQGFIDEINSQLQMENRIYEVKISDESRRVESQFVLSQKGIEVNYTFEAIISSLKEEMENEITKILFQY